MTWYAYECSFAGCPRGPTGLVLNVRLDDTVLDPDVQLHVPCPLCGEELHFRSSWPATEGGYGSEADADGPPPAADSPPPAKPRAKPRKG